MTNRQIVLDTETTGLEPSQGHRIIEIGCVELVNRKLTGNHYHQYVNPEREIDQGALEVHGITNEFLDDKPLFANIVDEFLDYVNGAELVIHNASFDIGFINHELGLASSATRDILKSCTVVDSLLLARKKHPGQKNNLDALCKRYTIDNSRRNLHGALLDAEILADVYLAMTGGQVLFQLGEDSAENSGMESGVQGIKRLDSSRPRLKVATPGKEELKDHQRILDIIDQRSEGNCVWKKLV